MKTGYKFGEQTAEQRKLKGQNAWYCHFPHCKSVYHYTAECPNRKKFLFRFWRFIVYFER